MNDPKPGKSVNVARKKLIALIVLGIILLALAPAVPGFLDRFHFASSGFRSRMEWRILFIGLLLVVAPTYALFKFRHEKD